MSDNQEWLDNLKVGDDVAISTYQYGKNTFKISKVDKITPTRRFFVHGDYYDKEGNEIKKVSVWDSWSSLVPVTDEIRATIRRDYMLYKISKFSFDLLNNGDITSVYNIIKNKIVDRNE